MESRLLKKKPISVLLYWADKVGGQKYSEFSCLWEQTSASAAMEDKQRHLSPIGTSHTHSKFFSIPCPSAITWAIFCMIWYLKPALQHCLSVAENFLRTVGWSQVQQHSGDRCVVRYEAARWTVFQHKQHRDMSEPAHLAVTHLSLCFRGGAVDTKTTDSLYT